MHPMDELTPDQQSLPALWLDPDMLAGFALLYWDDCPWQARFLAASPISNAWRGWVIRMTVDDRLYLTGAHRRLVVGRIDDEVLGWRGGGIAAGPVIAIHNQAARFAGILLLRVTFGRYG